MMTVMCPKVGVRPTQPVTRWETPLGGRDVWLLSRRTGKAGSLKYSRRRMLEEAGRLGLSVRLVDANAVEIIRRPSGRTRYRYQGRAMSLPCAVFARAGAYTNLAARAIVASLEAEGVACFPSARGLAFGVDKLATAVALKRAGLPCPATIDLRPGQDIGALSDIIGYPLVVKPLAGLKGQHVSLCRTPADLARVLEKTGSKRQLLAQAFVSESAGQDLRILVAGGRVVAAMVREAPSGEFRSNVALGGQARAVAAPREAEQIALKAAQVLDLQIAAVDLLFGAEGFTICEVNVAPGFEALETVTGLNVAGAMMGLVPERSLAEHGFSAVALT